jgi:hypothetical protein
LHSLSTHRREWKKRTPTAEVFFFLFAPESDFEAVVGRSKARRRLFDLDCNLAVGGVFGIVARREEINLLSDNKHREKQRENRRHY